MIPGGLSVVAVTCGVAQAGAPSEAASQLLLNAETAYREGRLDEAMDLAQRALRADRASTGARRLIIEIAIRQGDEVTATSALAEFATLRSRTVSDLKWIHRAETRVKVDTAERAGDLPGAMEALEQLRPAQGEMRPAELTWMSWAQLRLQVRLAEVSGDVAQARELLREAPARDGSPEDLWVRVAHLRLDLIEAEHDCRWHRGAGALNQYWEFNAQTPTFGAWGTVAEARMNVRQAVTPTSPADALDDLDRFLELQQLTATDRAWAEGYRAWIIREAARVAGVQPEPSVLDQVASWREAFPFERGCEVLDAPASPSGRGASPGPREAVRPAPPDQNPWVQAETPRTGPRSGTSRPQTGPEPPGPSHTALNVTAEVEVGALRQADPAEDDGAVMDLTMGLSAGVYWSPVALTSRLSFGGTAGATGRATTLFYYTTDLWTGPGLRWPESRLAIVVGARSASRDRGTCTGSFCPGGGEPHRLILPVFYGGVYGAIQPTGSLELSLKAGVGRGNLNYFNVGALADLTCSVRPSDEHPLTLGATIGGTRGGYLQEAENGTDSDEQLWSTDQWLTISAGYAWGN